MVPYKSSKSKVRNVSKTLQSNDEIYRQKSKRVLNYKLFMKRKILRNSQIKLGFLVGTNLLSNRAKIKTNYIFIRKVKSNSKKNGTWI